MLEIEKVAPSSSTPSSEDVAEGVCTEPQLNASVDSGDYEIPQRKATTHPHRPKTVSLVKADARKVLERFLLMTEVAHGGLSFLDSSDVDGEHQYAVVAEQVLPPDQLPTPYQPMGSEESLDIKAGAAASSTVSKTAPIESDYVDCQMFLAGKSKLSGTRSLHTLGLLARSPGAKDLVQHPPKVKSKPKRTAFDSSSSSSTEDYEDYGNELLYRKKKSFFRWASERIQSFRYQGKKASGVSSGKRFSSKSDVPLPPPPTAGAMSGSGLHRDGSERSKSNSSSTPNESTEQAGLNPGAHRGAELETLAEEQQQRKSGLTWKKSDAGKEKKTNSAAEDKGKDGRSVFDGFLRQFRRGSAKLKGKGSRAKHRSRSADTVTIRRPNRDSMKLVQQFVDAQPRDPPSEWESDAATSRLSTMASRIECYALATPPLPAKLSDLRTGSKYGSHRALRHKMNLEGLITCRPQMPTPSGQEPTAASLSLRDTTDGLLGLPDLEQTLMHKSSKPFSDKSEREKEELYERIAEQLAAIADRLNLESPRSVRSSGHSGPEDDKLELNETAVVIEQEQASSLHLDVPIPRPTGDSSTVSIEVSSAPVVAELVQNATHGDISRFQQIVSDSVGSDTGWQAIARMFRLTQSAVQLAGMGTQVAIQIKEMTLNYFEDRFADWIVDQGGWESMVEETNTELDSELD